jgi:hypothetical protein
MEVQRIQFEVPVNRFRELESLMEEGGIATKKELLNNALTLFEWAINEVKQGHTIASVDESDQKYREITMPTFRNVKRKPNIVQVSA